LRNNTQRYLKTRFLTREIELVFSFSLFSFFLFFSSSLSLSLSLFFLLLNPVFDERHFFSSFFREKRGEERCARKDLSLSLFLWFFSHSVQKNDKIFFTRKERDDGTERTTPCCRE